MSLLSIKVMGKNNIWNSLRAFSAIFLLLFYMISNTSVEVFHQFVHAHDDTAIAHTLQDEKDPCHRTIYHASKDNSCAHEHLTKIKKCNLCDLISHTDQVVVSFSLNPFNPSYFSHGLFVIQDWHGNTITGLPSRGPPALSAWC